MVQNLFFTWNGEEKMFRELLFEILKLILPKNSVGTAQESTLVLPKQWVSK